MIIEKYKSEKGWYWSVGDRFWRNTNFGRTGIGIESSLIKNHDVLEIEVGTSKYLLDCKKAVAFIREHSSFETLKKKKIGYIPRSFLELIESPKPTPKEIKDIQPSLL